MQPNTPVLSIWLLRWCKIICNYVKQISQLTVCMVAANTISCIFCHIQYQESTIPSKIYLIQDDTSDCSFPKDCFPFLEWHCSLLIYSLWLQRNYQPENGICLLHLQNLLYINFSVLLAFPVLQGTEALCRFISVPSKERSNTLCFWCWQRQE